MENYWKKTTCQWY